MEKELKMYPIVERIMKEMGLDTKELKSNSNCYPESYGKASYALLTRLCFDNMILCNNIRELDETIWDNMEGNWYDEENDCYDDIYQWYIVTTTTFFENYKDQFIMTYSDKLDQYILGVNHFGSSWSIIPTEVELVKE